MSEESEQVEVSVDVPPWNRSTFLGILWGGFSLATIFIAYRFTARWRAVRRFYLDDAFALAAWILITASCVLTHALLLELFKVVYGTSTASPETEPPRQNMARNLEAKAAADMLGYSALWAIKLSFLCFFRRIYENLDSWMKYWWIITAVTMFTFIGTTIASIFYYILIDYDCLSSIFEYRPRCTYEHLDHNLALTNVDIARGACDIFTDIIITLIPAIMLWKIRVSWRRKLIVGVVLSLTIITISLASLRLYLLISPSWVFENANLDMNWLNLEVYAALMALSLGSIRSAFARRDSRPRFTPPSERRNNVFSKHSPRRWIVSLLGTNCSKGTDSHETLFSQGATQWAVSVNGDMERIGQADAGKP